MENDATCYLICRPAKDFNSVHAGAQETWLQFARWAALSLYLRQQDGFGRLRREKIYFYASLCQTLFLR